MKYYKLLILSIHLLGGRPRTLPNIPGWTDLKNIFVLRTPDDAKAIVQLAAGKNVVICGASFIGMEVAAALVSKASKVQVCEFFSVPFERILGKEVCILLKTLFEFLCLYKVYDTDSIPYRVVYCMSLLVFIAF